MRAIWITSAFLPRGQRTCSQSLNYRHRSRLSSLLLNRRRSAAFEIKNARHLQPISATSTETGDNVAQIDATVEGEEIEIAFNVRYMAQVLGVLGAPQVALETTLSTEPGVVKPVGDDDFVHIIMPMHFGR